MSNSLEALLISDDTDLCNQIEQSLCTRLGLNLSWSSENDLRDTLHQEKPLVVIWDGRNLSPNWPHSINWIREHHHGRPIVALLHEHDDQVIERLNQLGVFLVLDTSSDSFFNQMLVYIFAILLDCEGKKPKVVQSC